MYRAVGNRCAVDLQQLSLPISDEQALNALSAQGFKVVTIDLCALAKSCVGQSRYQRGVELTKAPEVVDCSSFVKWLYAQRGVWLPRRTIQQREMGKGLALDQMIAGDLVFCTGWSNYYVNDPSQGVGHVGMALSDGTIIHAAHKGRGIVQESLDAFLGGSEFRGIRRYIPRYAQVLTVETPLEREIETSDDIRWVILQSLPE